MASSGYSIGIDLGTANTRTAIFRNGDPETIPHEGEFLMPSYVAFTETSRLVGSMAKSQAGINPSNTIFSALRFIGRDYADPEVQQIIARLPFRVAETADAPVFVVTYRYEELHITPTEILAMILARARTDALRYLGPGCHITSAVITVPSSFTFQQRQAIWNAAVIARLHPSRIISTAITICSDFVLTQRSVDMGNILIVDCGAGFIDVAIATVENGVIQVKSVGGGDSLIAGDDFDSGLMIFLADQFKQVWPKAPYWHVTKDPMVITSRILRRLRTACEKAKCELSSQKQTHIEIENLLPEHSISQTITRDDMAVSCSRIFSRITRPVASALDDAQINRWAIDAVILAGGSSRIPLFQSSLCEFLSKTQVSRCLKPDEAGARGAAYISAILSRDTSMALSQQLKLLDVVPASIGIEVVGGAMYKILEKNTTLPGSKQITIITPPNQKEYSIIIYEGEDARVENNKCLGRFTLRLAPDAQGVQQIRIDVNYATSGEVHVAASEPIHGAGESRYFSALHRISEAKLKSTRIAHEDFDAAERAEESRILERHGAEGYVVFVLERLSMHQSIHASQHQRELSASAEAALAWLDENPMASSLDYHSLRCKLEEQVESMVHAFPEIGYLKRPSLPGSIELASSYVEHVPESVGESNKNPTLPARAVVSEEKEATHQNDVGSNLARMQEEIATGILEGSSLNTPIAQGVPVYAVDEQLDLTPKPPTSYIDETYHTAPANNDSAFNQEWHDDKYAQMLEDDSLSASAAMVTPQDTAQTGIHRPVTLGSAELGMQDMFSSTREIGAVFTDIDFIQISTYLYSMGRPSWSKVPRLYTVLRLADQLAILDTFINQGITDIWFPFTQKSLPNTLSPTDRARFLEHQNVVLSKALVFEKNAARKHAHFAQDEPLPFHVVAKLGAGAHAHVDKVLSTVSHREYARKLFRRHRAVDKDAIKSFLVELQVLKRVQHYHCVELVQSYTDPKYFALLMLPVGDCNLNQYYSIVRNSPDKLSLLRSFFGCLANALQYIHNIKIRHRDIKPHNILVKGDRVFLTDFGIALDWQNLSRSTTTADSGKTWVYAAPEVAYYEKRNTAADVWSLGCVFMEMVTVLKGETVAAMRTFLEQRSGNYRFYTNIENMGQWAKKLRATGSEDDNIIFGWVRGMLDKDAEDRPTASELYDHIVKECAKQHVPFCGSCCVEDVDSSGVEDEGEDDLWQKAAELTIMPAMV